MIRWPCIGSKNLSNSSTYLCHIWSSGNSSKIKCFKTALTVSDDYATWCYYNGKSEKGSLFKVFSFLQNCWIDFFLCFWYVHKPRGKGLCRLFWLFNEQYEDAPTCIDYQYIWSKIFISFNLLIRILMWKLPNKK